SDSRSGDPYAIRITAPFTPPPAPSAAVRGGNPVSPTGPLRAAADAAHRRVLLREPAGSPKPPQCGMTSSCRHLRLGASAHELHEPREHVRVGVRQNAVPEVEHVPGSSTRATEDVRGLARDDLPRAEQRRRVEVALYCAIRNKLPAVVERDTPVQPDPV